MSYARWKYVERRMAKKVGGRRNTRKGDSEVDVEHDWLSIEVKSKEELPQWMAKGMAQAVTNAKPDQLPILLIHENYGAEYAMVRLDDGVDWFGFKDPKMGKLLRAWKKERARRDAATPSPTG